MIFHQCLLCVCVCVCKSQVSRERYGKEVEGMLSGTRANFPRALRLLGNLDLFPILFNTRHARAPTSPRSIGFCAIWDCISSSSSSPRTRRRRRRRRFWHRRRPCLLLPAPTRTPAAARPQPTLPGRPRSQPWTGSTWPSTTAPSPSPQTHRRPPHRRPKRRRPFPSRRPSSRPSPSRRRRPTAGPLRKMMAAAHSRHDSGETGYLI